MLVPVPTLPAVLTAVMVSAAVVTVQVFEQLGMIYLLQDNTATLFNRSRTVHDIPGQPNNRSQPTATVHNCSRVWDTLGGPWAWQRLTVPRTNTTFRPNISPALAPFPPPAYTNLTTDAQVNTPFLRGFAATIAPAALRSTHESRQMLLEGLNGPPGAKEEAAFRRAMRDVLQASATLDDKKKVIAECERLENLAILVVDCSWKGPGDCMPSISQPPSGMHSTE
jgi:hypothetical protein